jgi:hypothetical protein
MNIVDAADAIHYVPQFEFDDRDMREFVKPAPPQVARTTCAAVSG